jgi:hypothetical protein
VPVVLVGFLPLPNYGLPGASQRWQFIRQLFGDQRNETGTDGLVRPPPKEKSFQNTYIAGNTRRLVSTQMGPRTHPLPRANEYLPVFWKHPSLVGKRHRDKDMNSSQFRFTNGKRSREVCVFFAICESWLPIFFSISFCRLQVMCSGFLWRFWWRTGKGRRDHIAICIEYASPYRRSREGPVTRPSTSWTHRHMVMVISLSSHVQVRYYYGCFGCRGGSLLPSSISSTATRRFFRFGRERMQNTNSLKPDVGSLLGRPKGSGV